MKPHPRAILPFVMFGIVFAFLVTRWRAMPYAQRFMFICALGGVAGVWAFRAGGYWPLAWIVGVVLAAVLPLFYMIFDLFKIWRKKKS